MADKKKMSVEDILAACRSGGEGSGASPDAAEQEPAAPAKAAAAKDKPAVKPTAKPGGMSTADILAAARSAEPSSADSPTSESVPAESGKSAKSMSVAEMLAAARSGGKPAAKSAAEKPSAEKPAKSAAPKASPAAKATAKAAPQTAAEPRDTSSILAAARKSIKPGPMSKAEAAAKGKLIPTAKTVPPMPEKPAYARLNPNPKPVAAKKADEEDRRGFMAGLLDATLGSFLAVGFSSLAVVGGLWTLGFAKFMFPNILTEPPSRFKVGFPSDFAPDSVATKFKAQFGVWVVNTQYEGQPMITALKSVCTHLGCTPNWLEGEQKFKCPCHGSGFYKEGINFEGPAPRPLERYAIKISDDGQLEIDKSKTFQQEMGAWSDPACFVPV